MRNKYLTAAVGIPILILFFEKAPLWAVAAFLAVFSLMGLLETYELFSKKGITASKPVGLALGAAWYVAVSFIALQPLESRPVWLFAALTLCALICCLDVLAPRQARIETAAGRLVATVGGFIYVPFFMSFFVLLRGFNPADAEIGIDLIFYCLAVVWASDGGAFIFGSALGKTPLIPAVSPKKSVEGAIGGLLASTLTSWGAAAFLQMSLFSFTELLVLGLLIGLLGQLGDLVESALKRSAAVKDSGTLFPGHGGILDRADSLVVTAPLLYLYLTLRSMIFRKKEARTMLTLLSFIFVLGLLIFVHELGHFLVAKWAGVRVEVFSLGFGPALLSFTRGDTEYCICAIPLGGYVKMTGQDDMPGESGSQLLGADYEFPSKPWWQRLLIAFAGPAMNFIAAFVLFYGVYFFIGIPEVIMTNDTTVEKVSEGYPAQGVLQPGDKILAIDGQQISLWRDMVPLIQNSTKESLKLDIQRGTETLSLQVGVKVDEDDGQRRIGVVTAEPAILGKVHLDAQLPPENKHLRAGDQILSIAGKHLESWTEFEKTIQENPKQTLALQILRKEPFEVSLLTGQEQGKKLTDYGVILEGDKVFAVAAGSKAEEAGVKPGDTLLSETIQPIPFLKKLFRNIQGEKVEETLVVGLHRTLPFEMNITPIENPINNKGLIGVEKKLEVKYHQYLPLEALEVASMKFIDSSMVVFLVLKKLVTAELPASTLAGPVGIMQVTGKQAEKGLLDLLLLASMLSVNLAIVNLLPIPILDGSHILLCLVEGIRRKPIDAKIQGILQYAGLLILLPFILYVTFHDIIRWIRDVIG